MTSTHKDVANENRRTRAVLTIAVMLSILVLGAWLRFVGARDTVVVTPIRNDAMDYVSYAYNLKNFGVYSSSSAWATEAQETAAVLPDAKRPPGYPLQLLPLLNGTPDMEFVRRATYSQAWLSTFTIILSCAFAWRLLGLWPGIVVALFVSLSPHLAIFVSYLLSETSFALLLCVAATTAVGWAMARDKRRACAWALATGMALGMCSLIRPTLDQLPWVMLLLCLVLPALRAHRVAATLVACGFLLVMSPWLVRNWVSVGSLGDSRLMTSTLHHGSYPGFMYENDPSTRGYPYRADPRTPEVEVSLGATVAEVARKFRSEPVAHVTWYLVGKPVQFLAWEMIEGWGDIYTYPVYQSPHASDPTFGLVRSLMRGLHAPLGIAGVLGAILVLSPWARRFWSDGPLWGLRVCAFIFLYAIGVHMVGAPFPRYSVPFRPIQYLMAVSFGIAMVRAAGELRQRSQQRVP